VHCKGLRKISFVIDKLLLHLLRCNRIKVKIGQLVRGENSSIKRKNLVVICIASFISTASPCSSISLLVCE
jgi:hypothetical protein